MTDKTVDYALRSLTKYILDTVGVSGAYILTPDFDYDRSPDPTNLDKTKKRELPYASVAIVSDIDSAFALGNLLYDKDIIVNIGVYSPSSTDLMQRTALLKQQLRKATVTLTGEVGITLYDYAVASGSYYAQAGAVRIDLQTTEYFGPDDKDEFENRKHRSYTLAVLNYFKDVSATLLENLGNINISDVGV